MRDDHNLNTPRVRAALATAIAVLPVLVAGARAAVTGWVPIGDDAYFTVRSMDVATEHHPLVGAWSSGSAGLSEQINNLGPIQLDLLAPFTKIAPMGGTAIGVIAVHIAAIITIAWLVRRIAGYGSVVPAMAAVSLLTWVLGSEMLIAARQHQYLVIPYLCVLVAAWAATAGDRWALVPFVAGGSLVTQTHLSYPILVAALAIPVIGGQVYAASQRGVQQYRRPWIVATVLAAVLWVQTAIDQLFGWGNLGSVLSSPGQRPGPGLGTAFEIVAHVVVAARGYVRPGFGAYDPGTADVGAARTTLFVMLLVSIAAAAAFAFRRGHRTAASGLSVALFALCAAVINAASLPITQFGPSGLTAANYRWLWSTATFLVLGGLIAVYRYAPAVSVTGQRVVAYGCAAVLLVAALINLPSSQQVRQPDVYRDRLRVTAELTQQLRDVELEGPVLLDQTNLYFGHPFGYPVLVVLRDRGIEYRLFGSMQARRFGDSRAADGTEPQQLVLWRGDEALARLDAPNRVVYVAGTDPLVVLLETEGSE